MGRGHVSGVVVGWMFEGADGGIGPGCGSCCLFGIYYDR